MKRYRKFSSPDYLCENIKQNLGLHLIIRQTYLRGANRPTTAPHPTNIAVLRFQNTVISKNLARVRGHERARLIHRTGKRVKNNRTIKASWFFDKNEEQRNCRRTKEGMLPIQDFEGEKENKTEFNDGLGGEMEPSLDVSKAHHLRPSSTTLTFDTSTPFVSLHARTSDTKSE